MLNYSANSSSAGSSYLISNSLRFRASATAYLSRTPASAGNQKTWTWSGWVKRGALGTRGNLFGSVESQAMRHSGKFFDTSSARVIFPDSPFAIWSAKIPVSDVGEDAILPWIFTGSSIGMKERAVAMTSLRDVAE